MVVLSKYNGADETARDPNTMLVSEMRYWRYGSEPSLIIKVAERAPLALAAKFSGVVDWKQMTDLNTYGLIDHARD